MDILFLDIQYLLFKMKQCAIRPFHKTVISEDNILYMLLGTGFILGDTGKSYSSSMFSVGFNDIEK